MAAGSMNAGEGKAAAAFWKALWSAMTLASVFVQVAECVVTTVRSRSDGTGKTCTG